VGKENVKQLRRGLFAAVDIKKDTIIEKNMILIARPEKGLKPKNINLARNSNYLDFDTIV
tara:strand:+ start:97 stop:276 length:180 start_codon:yes stop_codon:yes gene_type:complete